MTADSRESDSRDSWYDPDVPVTKPDQLAGVLRDRIKSGALRGRLPSTAELMAQFNVAKPTVLKAVRTLKAEKLVEGRQGMGVFVTRQD
jgi:DNA-binding GntR family transcriptional regulator